jgi:hypothetical protein
VSFAHEILGAQITPERTIGRHALLMGPLMEQEVALEAERLAAVGAHVRTIAGMGQHVFEQRFLGREHLGADDTIVLCPRRVLAHVTFQMFFACKGSITEFASVWRLASVLTDVVGQILFSGERLHAECALVWRFAGVPPDVVNQMIFTSERLRTVLARERRFSCVLTLVVNHVVFTRE